MTLDAKAYPSDTPPGMTPAQFRRLRDSVGLTQAQAAKLLGVKRLAVVRYETGTRKISEPVARLWTRLVAEEKAKGKSGPKGGGR
jgi:DNA-binding transcriptional regulator YiaG